MKINAIYNLILALAQENHELVATFKLLDLRNKIATSEREAYLLKFEDAPTDKLYVAEGFEFSKRHLTVDRFYSSENSEKGQNGLAEAHYSEYYLHPTTGEEITVHVFFKDKSSYIQIKHSLNSVETYDIINQLPPYQINRILNNATAPLNLYGQLKNEFAARSYKQTEELDKDEKKLSLLSKTLASKIERQKYISFATELVQKIQKLNELGSLKLDVFKQQILDRISFVEKMADEPTSPIVNSAPGPAAMVAQINELESTKKLAIQKVENDYQAAQFEKLKSLEKDFDVSQKNKRDCDSIRFATEIRLISLEFYFFKKISAEQKNLTQQLELKIASAANAVDYAYNKFVEGEFEAFQSVFSLLTNHQEFSLINKIHEFILQKIQDQLELTEQQRNICDFLYENSVAYKLKIAASKDSVIMLGQTGVAMSMISLLCMWNLKQTFAMFLRHGLGVRGIGCFIDNKDISVLRIAIVTNNDPFYVKALLDHGATIDAPQSVWNAKQIKGLSLLIKEKASNNTNNATYDALIHTFSNKLIWSSDLIAACSFDRFALVPLLIEKSSYVQVALAIASTVADHSIICHREIGSLSGFKVYSSLHEQDEEGISNNASGNSIRSVFYSTPFADEKTPERLQALTSLIANFEERVLKTDAELLSVLAKLDAQTKNETLDNTKIILDACRFMISNKGPLNTAWAEKLAHYFCLVGNVIFKMQLPSVASSAFCFARKIGVAFAISEYPICVHAQKRIEQIAALNAPAFDINLINLYLKKIIPEYEELEEDKPQASSSSNIVPKHKAKNKKK